MAELTTLARPYAKAAFEYAKEAQNIASWSSSLSFIAGVVEYESIGDVLLSPTSSAKQKTEILFNLCDGQLDEKVKQFVVVMAENKRLGLLAHVYTLFEIFKSQQENFCDIQVQSAFELDDSVKQKLQEKLSQSLKQEISLSVDIDSRLIGGIVIRAGDTVIDGSVRGRLEKLSQAMSL